MSMTTDAGGDGILGVRAARALGLNPSTVSRYLKDYPELNLGNGTRPKVDVEDLRRHRGENTNPAHRGSHAGRLVGENDELAPAGAPEAPVTKSAESPNYALAKAVRETVLAQRAR